MPDTPISLDPLATALDGSEEFPILQGSINKKTTLDFLIEQKDIPRLAKSASVHDMFIDHTGTAVKLSAFLYEYFKFSIAASITADTDPGTSLLGFLNPDITLTNNSLYINNTALGGIGIAGFTTQVFGKPGAIIRVRALDSYKVYIGVVDSITNPTGYRILTLTKIMSTASPFTVGETIAIDYMGNGNVTYNSVSGNLEVNGISIGAPGGGTGGNSLLEYSYDATSTTIAAPGAGKVRLVEPDLLQATNTIVIDHTAASTLSVSNLLTTSSMSVNGIIILQAKASTNALVGLITAITVDTGFTRVDISRISSSATLTDTEDLVITYFSNGNVTYNSVTGNLEVGGVSIGDPADISQQFFKYKYNDTLTTTGIANGQIRFNNLDPKLATVGWITNRIDEADIININATLNKITAGTSFFVRAKNSVHFANFTVTSVASETVAGVGIKTITFTGTGAIDGVQFTPNEEVFVNFYNLGNVIYDATTKTLKVNDVTVSGISTVTNFTDLPDPSVSTNDNEAYKVLTPAVWMECDGELDDWVGFANRVRLYRNRRPIFVCAPSTVASAVADNGGRARITAVGHKLTESAHAGAEVTVISGTNWTPGNYRIYTVDSADAFTLDVPRGTLGTPVIARTTGTDKIIIAEVSNPILTGRTMIRAEIFGLTTENSVENKKIGLELINSAGTASVEFQEVNFNATNNKGFSCKWKVRCFRDKSTVTLTIASPSVITWVGHGFSNGYPILLTTTGALPTGLTANTIYYIVSATANTFRLSLTPGGAAINTTGSQSGVHTAHMVGAQQSGYLLAGVGTAGTLVSASAGAAPIVGTIPTYQAGTKLRLYALLSDHTTLGNFIKVNDISIELES